MFYGPRRTITNFNLAALVPNEAIQAVVGAGSNQSDFIEKYAESVAAITERVNEYEELEDARSGLFERICQN